MGADIWFFFLMNTCHIDLIVFHSPKKKKKEKKNRDCVWTIFWDVRLCLKFELVFLSIYEPLSVFI